MRAAWRLVLAAAALLAGCETRYAGTHWSGGGTGTPVPCIDPNDGGTCARSQPILSCAVRNARDLGGVPLAPAGNASCGQIFRGPPLASLSAQGCADAARLGVRTIIDLRTESERVALPDAACLGANVVLAPLPVPYNVSPEDYLADFDSTESMARVFHTLGDEAAYPIYFHCTYGRDRTGVVAAAVLLAVGARRARTS
jgi:protein-tyrosine phosphatase